MDWKKFFKPSISKIILTLVIFFIVLAFPRYGEYYGHTCPINVPCKPAIGFVFFSGFYFFGGIVHNIFESALNIRSGALVFTIYMASLIFISYTLSCLFIYLYKKFKK